MRMFHSETKKPNLPRDLEKGESPLPQTPHTALLRKSISSKVSPYQDSDEYSSDLMHGSGSSRLDSRLSSLEISQCTCQKRAGAMSSVLFGSVSEKCLPNCPKISAMSVEEVVPKPWTPLNSRSLDNTQTPEERLLCDEELDSYECTSGDDNSTEIKSMALTRSKDSTSQLSSVELGIEIGRLQAATNKKDDCQCYFCQKDDVQYDSMLFNKECSAETGAKMLGSEISSNEGAFGKVIEKGKSFLFAGEDGVCRLLNTMNWKERKRYELPEGFRLGRPGGIWLLETPWHEDDIQLVVLVSRNLPAFCSWDFETGEVVTAWFDPNFDSDTGITSQGPYDSLRQDKRASLPCNLERRELFQSFEVKSWSDAKPKKWWLQPSGSLLIVGCCGMRTIKMVDIRDGEIVSSVKLVTPLARMPVSSPLQWLDRKRLVVAEEAGLGLWDVRGGRMQSTRFVELSKRWPNAELMTSVLSLVVEDENQNKVAKQPLFDGALGTTSAIYLLKWEDPRILIQKITLDIEHPPDVMAVDSVFIYAGSQGAPQFMHTKIMKWSYENGELVDQFIMERKLPSARRGPVSQLFVGGGQVCGVHAGGLFFFLENKKWEMWPESETEKGDSDWDPRIISVMSQGLPDGLAYPSFNAVGDRILLLSANHCPRIYWAEFKV